ncbi:MAG: efflux RND transporter periplasmic adaptor subunit [Planctomycetes bacterium]|nr:efflux RND transporter periplasmic adaptor subunit [Planctomycetota bacterium]
MKVYSVHWFWVTVMIISLPGCSKESELKPKSNKTKRIPTVVAEKIKFGSFTKWHKTVGQIEPYERVIIAARISGIVKKVNVNEGDLVKSGDLLAIIDDRDARLAFESAKIQLQGAETEYESARDAYKRWDPIFREGKISKDEFQQSETRYKVADAAFKRAKNNLENSENNLNDCTVITPSLTTEGGNSSVEFIVLKRKVTEGESVSVGKDLFHLGALRITGENGAGSDGNQFKATLHIPEDYVDEISRKTDVVIKVSAIDGEFKGTIVEIGGELSEMSRSAKIKALISDTSGKLRTGMTCDAVIRVRDYNDVMLVPLVAVEFDSDGTYLLVVRENKVYRSNVHMLAQDEKSAAVESDQIKEGDLIVTRKGPYLADGMEVTVISE